MTFIISAASETLLVIGPTCDKVPKKFSGKIGTLPEVPLNPKTPYAKSKKEAEERIAAQATDNERKNVADYLIDNNGTIEDLSKEVDKLWGIVEIWHSNHSNDCMDRESEY